MPKAEFEVRITPLMRGVPGGMEVDGAPSGVTVIEESDTTLVQQILDLEVNHDLNDFRTGTVVLSIHDPIVADLEPFAQAVWIGYKRPLETLSEAILYGQCNVVTDYAAERVTLEIQDPSLRLQHHYIRRGDEALNVDKNRGRLELHPDSIYPIVEAARNIDLQQNRNVPALGLYVDTFYFTGAIEEASFIDFERGQECWDLIQQIVRGVSGPDIDIVPQWTFPTSGWYAILDAHDPADPPNPVSTALSRNLDPVDPDDPDPGEVVFDFGIGQDNLEALEERPTRPTTHAHVLDEPAVFRETSADADSSEQVGVFVDWIGVGFAIRLPTRGSDGLGNHTVVPADTSPLRAIADAHIKAYGRPPRFLTLTLRPDDALGFHYGHPNWIYSVPEGVEYQGGEWYIGDLVRVRGVRGERSVNELVRIVGVKFKYDLQRDLVIVSVNTIPAVGGVPGRDLEEGELGGAFPGGGTGIGSGDTGSGDGTTVGGGGSTGLVMPSGEAMPSTDLPGWRLIFADDFDTNIALGSFPAADSDNWFAYPDGWGDTSRNGRYDATRVVSVHDGMMDMYLHSATIDGVTKHLVAAPVPLLPGDDPAVYNGTSPYRGMLHGRYAVRFRADAIPGYKTAWLLWPLSDVWPRDGEIDFPEGDLGAGDTIWAFMHRQNGTAGNDQDAANTGETYADWHTAVLEWGPTECKFILDGVTVMNPVSRIPNTPMRWVLQTETQLSGGPPLSSVSGHVYVDWVAVWAYDP